MYFILKQRVKRKKKKRKKNWGKTKEGHQPTHFSEIFKIEKEAC